MCGHDLFCPTYGTTEVCKEGECCLYNHGGEDKWLKVKKENEEFSALLRKAFEKKRVVD